ncbi:sensor histidine kinase [Abyssalbus ytuae]|uniref:histidine kinase n=1 Tax=Abyssalbus ytuae TaxID=2926907 RepID=A0A9E6ZP07_9FLAO|nr:HAMP domain-containing sensor histidine kinase [Abyssalbus ytuae]UOB19484.1 HAMP domain-containing histidine kinase [Abyssalbus ytuae]
MILLVVIASVLIAGVTIYQYKEQSIDYHRDRLERKEEQVKASIDYELLKTTWEVKTENLKYIFKDEIFKIADVHNLNFNIYDLEGNLIRSSKPRFEDDSVSNCLAPEILNGLIRSSNKRYVLKNHVAGESFQSSYTYINDSKFKPIGILNIPYFEDDSFNTTELKEFLMRLAAVYFLMFIIAIVLAYLVSKYITRSLKAVSIKLDQTKLSKRNEKIFLDKPSQEIGDLVDAYNGMVDELEESAVKLARSEREQAWREMAKQVAHEIKNPLTPMRLSVQSFERKFNLEDPEMEKKVSEFSKTLIQQIDTMSSIASAFSSFAQMPAQQNETLNVVKTVKLALDIFNEGCIRFISEKEEIIAKLDRTQLIRVVTNLVKNAIQSIPEDRERKIVVSVFSEGKNVKISVADNGAGISDLNREKVFEPKFTTKTSGMGLGLAMVKNIVESYKGEINFTSVADKGTVFTVTLPRA